VQTTNGTFLRRYPEIVLTDFERGWLLGLIEGEGTITIKNQGSKNRPNHQYPQATIIVCNTIPELLREVKAVVGPGIIKRPHGGGKGFGTTYRRSTAWEYYLTGNKSVGQILELLGDSFIVKKDVAALVLAYCQSRSSNLRQPLSDYETDIIQTVHRLNTARYHKGGEETSPNPR
jgi:hypothetical protein